MEAAMMKPHAPKPLPSTAHSTVISFLSRVEAKEEFPPLPKTDYHYKKLRKVAVSIFTTLIVTSTLAAMFFLYMYFNLSHLNELTNMYPAFFGFISATAINIVGSIAGLATLYEPENEKGEVIDKSHSKAVTWLLIAGIIFNAIFPTSGLMPLEADSKMRLPKTSISDCGVLEHMQLPECEHYNRTESTLHMMYLLIIIEVITLVFYSGVWLRRGTVIAFLKLLKGVKMKEVIQNQNNHKEFSINDYDDEWLKLATADEDISKVESQSQSHSFSELY